MPPTMRRSAGVHDWLIAHDRVPISLWCDPTVEGSGFDVRSAYVETYWLALLGPSCVLAARRLMAWLEAEPDGFVLSLVALAGTLGLGSGTGRSAPIVRTLSRLVDFHVAMIGETYAIRRALPQLSSRQLARLPDHLAAAHTIDHASAVMRR